eukprot:1341213-Amorphochlora_amoeboformis.AAC.1
MHTHLYIHTIGFTESGRGSNRSPCILSQLDGFRVDKFVSAGQHRLGSEPQKSAPHAHLQEEEKEGRMWKKERDKGRSEKESEKSESERKAEIEVGLGLSREKTRAN